MPQTLDETAITHPLDTLRGLIRRYVLLDGLLTAALFAILWFWLGLAVDYGLFKATHFDWVLDAPKLLRILALAVLAFVLLAILITRLWIRLHRELSYPSLALVLEKRFPKILGDKLITAVELADVGKAKSHGFSEEMLRATIDDARESVKEVPVRTVFNWRRLRMKALLLALFAAGTLLVVFGVYSLVKGTAAPARFASSFGDVSLIWAERNLLLRNTPWPRQAHLELVNFDGDEMRVGKDSAAPRISARAYRWVLADNNAIHGWRPACWTDLPTLLPGESTEIPSEMRDWDLDRIESSSTDSLKPIFERLDALAGESGNSRRFRKLAIPDAVTLTYNGPKSSGTVSLTREPNNVFAGAVSGLKESVRFTVKGSDFATMPRSITLVPPPMLTRLTRTEYEPAYLYHPPPVDDPAAPVDHALLKGLRQTIAEKDLSLTGDKSVFSIVRGTEFDIAGISDKKLARVLLKPKIGTLPGQTNPTDVVTLEPEGPDRDRFRVAFRGNDKPLTNLEFDVVLIDDDNVSTTRSMLVQVVEDQAPSVELAVDVLRKQGNNYLVTPIAMVPFLTESKVRDDLALGKVEFTYTVSKVESNVMLALQTQALAAVFANVPLMPTIADAYVPALTASFAQASTKSGETKSGAMMVPRFADQFKGLRRETLAALKAKLAKPLEADAAQAIREVKFQNQTTDYFDLREALPQLGNTAEGSDYNQRYRIELMLTATDANVETGPKTGTSLEPIRLLVITQEDLLSEISRDEETQATRLDDVIKKLREAQSKLANTADRLTSLTIAPEEIVASAVRAQDIAQDIAKSREITAGVLTEYRRIYREAEFNRIRVEILNRYATEIIGPLNTIIEKSFADAEQSHGEFQTALNEGRRPDDPVVVSDRFALSRLIAEVVALREKLGEAVTLNNLRAELTKVHERQVAIGRMLKSIKESLLRELYLPKIVAIPTIELMKGETKVIKQGINWRVYTGGALTVNMTGPGEALLKVPAMVKVSDEREDFDYQLTAGQTPGDYKITLTPSAGSPIEVNVTIKP